MLADFFSFLERVDTFLWYRIGFALIIILGAYFSIKFRFAQVLKFPHILKNFWDSIKSYDKKSVGVHPLYAFFTSIGGCIGIGNIVGVCFAVQVGGPGAVFWIWIVALLGMIVKYSEIYLGIKHRVKNENGSYDGGPMYFLKKAFKTPLIPILFCLVFCVYGAEIFTFNVVTNSIVTNWGVNRTLVIVGLIALIIFASSGGVRRVGKICSALIPIFVVLFLSMSFWVLFSNFSTLGQVFASIFKHAFTPHAAVGGFAGSTLMITISQGLARACYSGDIGVGYASIVHAETCTSKPERQASLDIFGIFLDTFVICTMSTILILVTGVWQEGVDITLSVQTALSKYFPMMKIFMPIFMFLLGYSTIIAFFCAGIKCAKFLSPKFGVAIYYVYAVAVFLAFSLVDQNNAVSYAIIIMSIAGVTLLIMNLIGIFLLRKEIKPPI